MDNRSPQNRTQDEWVKIGDAAHPIYYLKSLLELGIPVITDIDPATHGENFPVNSSLLRLQEGSRLERVLAITNNSPAAATPNSSTSSTTTNNVPPKVHSPVFNHLMSLRSKFLGQEPSDGVVIVNPKRRDEMLIPITLEDEQGKIGFYANPWIPTNSSETDKKAYENFSNFSHFITESCFFGASLKGRYHQDGEAKWFPLLRNTEYPDYLLIDGVELSKEESAYEHMYFVQFENQLRFINKVSGSTKTASFHLPSFDYKLSAIELLFNGHFKDLETLNAEIILIIEKCLAFDKRVRDLCNRYNIPVEIASPFDNLFGELIPPTAKNNFYIPEAAAASGKVFKNTLDAFLYVLGIDEPEKLVGIPPKMWTDEMRRERKALEEKVAISMLEKLKTNKYNEKQASVWQDFAYVVDACRDVTKDSKKPEDQATAAVAKLTIAKLLRMGNGAMIALGTRNRKPYEALSALPITGKSIQLSYDEYTNKLLNKLLSTYKNKLSLGKQNVLTQIMVRYPAVLFLTLIESMFVYDAKSLLYKAPASSDVNNDASTKAATAQRGLAFYSDIPGLAKTLAESQLLQIAAANVARHADKVSNKIPKDKMIKKDARTEEKLKKQQEMLANSEKKAKDPLNRKKKKTGRRKHTHVCPSTTASLLNKQNVAKLSGDTAYDDGLPRVATPLFVAELDDDVTVQRDHDHEEKLNQLDCEPIDIETMMGRRSCNSRPRSRASSSSSHYTGDPTSTKSATSTACSSPKLPRRTLSSSGSDVTVDPNSPPRSGASSPRYDGATSPRYRAYALASTIDGNNAFRYGDDRFFKRGTIFVSSPPTSPLSTSPPSDSFFRQHRESRAPARRSPCKQSSSSGPTCSQSSSSGSRSEVATPRSTPNKSS